MIIGVDVDDVLIDTNPFLLEHLNGLFGTRFRREDVTKYLIQGLFGEKAKLAEEEIYRFIEEKGDMLQALEGSKEVIKVLSKRNEIIAVTARMGVDDLTRNCLSREFDGRIKEVYFAGLSGKSRKKKSEVIREQNIELYIDDNLDYAFDCASATRRILLYNKPWNRNGSLPSNVKRVYNWQEILREVESLKPAQNSEDVNGLF